MMLSLGGIVLEVQHDGAEERESYEVGDSERAFDGTYLTSVSDEKREWAFVTGPMVDAEIAALRPVISLRKAVAGDGDALDGAPFTVHARINRIEYIPDDLYHRRVVYLSVFEA